MPYDRRTIDHRGTMNNIRRALTATTVAAMLLTAACSSDDSSSDSTTTSADTASTTTAPAGDGGAVCDQEPTLDPVETEPVEGVESDLTLTSWDGTEIRIHWFPTDQASTGAPAPTVLMGPGWSLAGDTNAEGGALFGALGIGSMNESGYNVLTWDPRGFGQSEGRAMVDDPAHEGRDAQALLDWVASQPEAELDRAGDPRVGMVGFSYGGGIQWALAGMDCRVDVLVPGIAWNSLVTSLGRNETLKAGWAGLLVGLVDRDSVAPEVVESYEQGTSTATVSEEHREWFAARGPGENIDKVTVPTLIVQGTVDTLFTLDEAVTNYEALSAGGVPVKMLWFCGGHGACLTDPGDDSRISEASFAWLDRYLKGDESVDTGPAIDIIDQDGTRWFADSYPTQGGAGDISASGAGTLELIAEGGAGPLTRPAADGDVVGGISLDINPARADNSVDVVVTAADEALVVGAPKLTITYRGTTPSDKPSRVFAQLVDDERDVVVGNQITPIVVTLDGEEHTTTVDLEIIAQHLKAGDTLTLQLVATTTAYAVPGLGGSITFETIEVVLPVPSGFEAG